MPDTAATRRSEWGVAFEVMAAGLGMFLFGLCVHLRPPFVYLAPAGLLMAALSLVCFLGTEASPAAALGLSRFGRRAAVGSGVGIVIGLVIGPLYRTRWGWAIAPRALTGLALLFALIGATEELLYRGYMQGRLRRWGPVGAVLAAAFFHALYKLALFGSLPALLAEDADCVFLVVVTFLGGLGFGALREVSGSVVPPLLAHVVFDIVVYGERAAAPGWVWS
ncbi:MAG TPA: CPBP family intramembrane metalloprotease [Planctomycetota bacterium]|nr:CPBP family intramembrane metalloprotease [Planctomycetota bacterium]HRR78915.1 CPBP family intramembrane metalloprotease [Planctomycetota bacterium]HRT92807.1 CPBP family intramembrane metalloprotease [Planctomycetota bacterium]